MEAVGLGDDFTSLDEDEDLAIEAAKVIVHMDTEKLQLLGVDLDFPEVASPRWERRFSGAWRNDQNIQVLEARALVM